MRNQVPESVVVGPEGLPHDSNINALADSGTGDQAAENREAVSGGVPLSEGGRSRIRCGDHVLHEPSGEEWVVAYADYESGYLAWCGWPEGRALISDCRLTMAGSKDDFRRTYEGVTGMCTPDHRSSTCRRLYEEVISFLDHGDALEASASDDDEWSELVEDCGMMPDGQCTKAGSEFCDWDCPRDRPSERQGALIALADKEA